MVASYRTLLQVSLNELESRWLERIRPKTEGRAERVTALVEYWKNDPNTACYAAQTQTRKFEIIKLIAKIREKKFASS